MRRIRGEMHFLLLTRFKVGKLNLTGFVGQLASLGCFNQQTSDGG